jgi:hypothetical protein
MTDAQYLTALYPDQYLVLGRRMAHFTLGHALLLERLESPFMVHSRIPAAGDVRLALAICSRRYPRACAFADSRFMKWRLPRVRSRDVLPGAAQMFDYIRAYQQHPECWSGRGGGRLMGTPFFQAVKLTHVMHLGKTELEALCTPLSLALWDYASCWELLEKMELVSGPDREAMRSLESMNNQPVNGNGSGRI